MLNRNCACGNPKDQAATICRDCWLSVPSELKYRYRATLDNPELRRIYAKQLVDHAASRVTRDPFPMGPGHAARYNTDLYKLIEGQSILPTDVYAGDPPPSVPIARLIEIGPPDASGNIMARFEFSSIAPGEPLPEGFQYVRPTGVRFDVPGGATVDHTFKAEVAPE